MRFLEFMDSFTEKKQHEMVTSFGFYWRNF